MWWLCTSAFAGQLDLDLTAVDFDPSVETQRSISRILARVHGTYESWLGLVLPGLVPLHVEMIASEAAYRDRESGVAAELRGHTVGFFVPSKGQVVVYRGPGELQMRRTIVHETSHYLLSSAGLGRVPLWLNEGLAEVFETAVLDGNAVWLVPNPETIKWIAGRPLPTASSLIGRSTADWNAVAASSPWGRAEYPYGWALSAFLLSGDAGRKTLSELLMSTAVSREPGVDGLAAVNRTYPGGQAALDRDFKAWFVSPGRIQLPMHNDSGQQSGWVKCADGSLIRPEAGYKCGRWVKGDDGMMRYIED